MEKFKQFAVQKMAKKCNKNEEKIVQDDKKIFICQEKVVSQTSLLICSKKNLKFNKAESHAKYLLLTKIIY